MKRKWISMYLGLAVIAAMGMTVPAAAAETPAAVEAEAEGETAAKAEIKLTVKDAEITIMNETETEVTSAQVEEASDSETEGVCTVILTAADGQHTFEGAVPEKWTEPRLIEDHGFLYIRYTEADGSSRDAAETGEAVTPEDELTMWSVANVNMREETNADSKIVKTVALGDECKVLKILPGWFQVEYQEATGYINHKYLSDNKEEADSAVQREKAAQEAAAAAAAAAQSESYSYSYSGSGSGSSGGGGGSSAEECLTNGLLN